MTMADTSFGQMAPELYPKSALGLMVSNHAEPFDIRSSGTLPYADSLFDMALLVN